MHALTKSWKSSVGSGLFLCAVLACLSCEYDYQPAPYLNQAATAKPLEEPACPQCEPAKCEPCAPTACAPCATVTCKEEPEAQPSAVADSTAVTEPEIVEPQEEPTTPPTKVTVHSRRRSAKRSVEPRSVEQEKKYSDDDVAVKLDKQHSVILCDESGRPGEHTTNYWEMDFDRELAQHCYRRICVIRSGKQHCVESGRRDIGAEYANRD